MVLLSARGIDRRDFRSRTVGFAGHTEILDTLYLPFGTKAALHPTGTMLPAIVGLLRAFTEVEGPNFVQRSRSPVAKPEPREP